MWGLHGKEKGRKHCEYWRKCWLPEFSPSPTMFSEGFSYRAINSPDCVKPDCQISILTLFSTFIFQIVEQRQDGAWKGTLMKDGCTAKPGWFPADHVVLIDNNGELLFIYPGKSCCNRTDC